jgi:hypothetical protein
VARSEVTGLTEKELDRELEALGGWRRRTTSFRKRSQPGRGGRAVAASDAGLSRVRFGVVRAPEGRGRPTRRRAQRCWRGRAPVGDLQPPAAHVTGRAWTPRPPRRYSDRHRHAPGSHQRPPPRARQGGQARQTPSSPRTTPSRCARV